MKEKPSKRRDATRAQLPIGSRVWFFRHTVRGPVRVFGVVDSYNDDSNREWIVRTNTGRNVRISPSMIHRTNIGAHRK